MKAADESVMILLQRIQEQVVPPSRLGQNPLGNTKARNYTAGFRCQIERSPPGPIGPFKEINIGNKGKSIESKERNTQTHKKKTKTKE